MKKRVKIVDPTAWADMHQRMRILVETRAEAWEARPMTITIKVKKGGREMAKIMAYGREWL